MSHVLLVEDNPWNQAVIEDIFRYDNVPGDLVCVDCAEKALQLLSALDPLAVLMDLTLPGMSGIEATKIIKGAAANKDLQVWVISARNGRSDIDEAMAAGCNRYFTKPFARKQLAEQLRMLFERETSESLEFQPVRQTDGHDLAC
jgi:CheY-like chemotaxis protein